MGEIHFRFQEKANADDYAIAISSALNKPYAREHVVSGRARVWEYDEEAVRALLEEMVPGRARVMFCAREFPDEPSNVQTGAEVNGVEGGWTKETWYGTEYRMRRMEEGLLKEERNDIDAFHLPRPNEFLPRRLDVEKVDVEEPSKAPVKIEDSPASVLWYKKDDQFWVPKAVYYANIVTPIAQVTPRNAVKTRMYTNLINDALTEYSYDASLAGLNYRCHGVERGLFFSVGGYNDKIPVLAKTVLDKMKNIKVDPARFEVLKEDLIQEYENFDLTEPYRYADYLVNYLMAERAWTPKEKLAELKTLTVAEVQEHVEELFLRTYVEALAHGNISEKEGVSMLEMTEQVLGSRNLFPMEKLYERSLILPEARFH
ncbi:hypothetical protein M422DRAFT_67605 [Sphaerobolus stellatus SS14]|uniref:Peptidase M16 middle/third domain-containing protein n=1 Tax=Sphaerobolus stellatus (strain SS14) TaxID=990650 RepID=A0A0C9UMZ0_SPHS4|nr:hypothetical protein M422DRAFT_67605 [Sphaerobolus stellatus SS14]